MKRLLYILLIVPAIAWAVSGDDKFLGAREAYRVGASERLAQMTQALKVVPGGHDLAPWAEYWQLSLQLSQQGGDAGVADFLARNSGTYLAEKLRADWLKALGKRGAWADFQASFALLRDADQETTCYAWQARLALDNDNNVLEAARELWFVPVELPASCQPLLDRLVSDQRLRAADVWARVRSMLELAKYAEAQSAARYLPERQMPDGKTLERIVARPARYLDHLPGDLANNRQSREAVLFALQRQARKDAVDAAARWRRIEAYFDADDRGYMWGQLARRAAQAHLSQALAWYDAAGDAPLSEEQMAWRVRAALRILDWPAVLRAIERMPADLAARPDWIYWRARALAATGRKEDAFALYRTICAQPGFYGLLAAEELGLPLNLPPQAASATSAELVKVGANPDLRQALALFRLDLRVEAVREWNWAMRGMSDRDLLAASELARRNDIFDRAISAAEKTLVEHDYSLRYLAPYRDAILPRTKALALDDSWVYGLMRQESRFVTSARSGVGASGLMQVMPSTAKIVARKIGLRGYRPGQVNDMETNVTLGTHYLKMVLDSLDNHPVLACTAYNAGPGRAKRWRGDQALEGAIYAETIPFTETRDYVKKVMANSVYYSALFDEKPQTLKSRLGVIQPHTSADIDKPGEENEALP
ncbi:Soluble lytic murein transglycosylase precursor [Georgfuchsia toluolica]|uniref:Soluble lytic murein transglycosylase n=1 Tax=Georgfuchsia toluolica TaxID=424218 RepID=A0A916J531_9PROT|nr:lytic transglycosylase domain-containing protein [Georgfuchsia toluolica]CAG4884839.1 Soluble lytic murein transglycosylase precursor [Georgfuchsia toluolica]